MYIVLAAPFLETDGEPSTPLIIKSSIICADRPQQRSRLSTEQNTYCLLESGVAGHTDPQQSNSEPDSTKLKRLSDLKLITHWFEWNGGTAKASYMVAWHWLALFSDIPVGVSSWKLCWSQRKYRLCLRGRSTRHGLHTTLNKGLLFTNVQSSALNLILY